MLSPPRGSCKFLNDPLLLALSIDTNHSSYRLLKEARLFSVNVLKKGQLDLANHYRPASPSRQIGFDGLDERSHWPTLVA